MQVDIEAIKWHGYLSSPVKLQGLAHQTDNCRLDAHRTGIVGLMQNGRATPGTISSGPRRSGRPSGGKPASGLGSKKRKHSSSTSPGNSESQDAPSSNTSGGMHFAHC